MKIIVSVLLLIISSVVFGQKKNFKQKTLMEISSLLENPFEFLDKSDSMILASGRPATIQGGNKWEIGAVDSTKAGDQDIKEAIVIGTGCGALTLFIYNKSPFVKTIMYLPHTNAKINEQDIKQFRNKYSLSASGVAILEKNSKQLGLTVTPHLVVIAALY